MDHKKTYWRLDRLGNTGWRRMAIYHAPEAVVHAWEAAKAEFGAANVRAVVVPNDGPEHTIRGPWAVVFDTKFCKSEWHYSSPAHAEQAMVSWLVRNGFEYRDSDRTKAVWTGPSKPGDIPDEMYTFANGVKGPDGHFYSVANYFSTEDGKPMFPALGIGE